MGGTGRQAQGNAGRKILAKLGMQIAVNQLLLIGTAGQLSAAKKLLSAGAGSP